MQTIMRRHFLVDPYLFRWLARASAMVLVAVWVVFVLAESMRSHFEPPAIQTYYQAGALVIIFAGYAIGWRKELAGGLIAILGTLAYVVVHALTLNTYPHLAAAWFAAPGVLFLAAWLDQKAWPRIMRPR